MGEEEQGVIAGGIVVGESLAVLPTATLLVLLLTKERAIDSQWVKQRLIILINRDTAIRLGGGAFGVDVGELSPPIPGGQNKFTIPY